MDRLDIRELPRDTKIIVTVDDLLVFFQRAVTHGIVRGKYGIKSDEDMTIKGEIV